MKLRPFVRHLIVLGLLGAAAGLPGGCAADRGAPPPPPSERIAEGDPGHDAQPAPGFTPAPIERARWRDVDAAVRSAASRHGLAVMRIESPAPNLRVFELIGSRGEPGALRVSVDAASLRDDHTIDPRAPSAALRIELGRFGDPSRESRMMESIRTWRASYRR